MRKSLLFLSLMAAAVLYFLLEELNASGLMAILIPVSMHELGHILVLLLCKAEIKGVRIEACGLCIQYSGILSQKAEIAAALSGPAAGLIYTLLIQSLNLYRFCRFFQLSADISLLLSFFNLLPVLPLDGGLALLHFSELFLEDDTAEKLCQVTSLVFSGDILLTGLILTLDDRGQALLAAGLWLIICQSENMGIVKNQKLL